MAKKIYFYIDDHMYCFRKLAKNRPASLFDEPYFAMLKEAHDKYGMKVQLNIFYELDEWYNEGTFTIAEVPDTYKAEWEANSDWLKLAWHGTKECPAFLYLNISYDEMKESYMKVKNEIIRFAGEKSLATGITVHWLPVSKAGTKALYDCGVRILNSSTGDAYEYDPETTVIHHEEWREVFLKNRQPEARFYDTVVGGIYPQTMLCSYNHIPTETNEKLVGTLGYIDDEETGMKLKEFGANICLNLVPVEDLHGRYEQELKNDYVCVGTHEQFFHEEYRYYQPETTEKIHSMAKFFHDHGYEFFFIDELAK